MSVGLIHQIAWVRIVAALDVNGEYVADLWDRRLRAGCAVTGRIRSASPRRQGALCGAAGRVRRGRCDGRERYMICPTVAGADIR